MALHSTDGGFSWTYSGVVASADEVPYAHEGPSENALAYLRNGSIVCVMRVEGESGHHSPYISKVGATHVFHVAVTRGRYTWPLHVASQLSGWRHALMPRAQSTCQQHLVSASAFAFVLKMAHKLTLPITPKRKLRRAAAPSQP